MLQTWSLERCLFVFGGALLLNVGLQLGCSSRESEESTTLATGGGHRITGRMSMGPSDPFQCQTQRPDDPFKFSYTGPEKVNGKWIAGADGVTLGTTKDTTNPADKGSACGRTFIIRVGDKCEEFIIADRIWENDGPGYSTYNNYGASKSKSQGTGSGYLQLDIAVEPFRKLFGGHNPTGGYTLEWGTRCGSSQQTNAPTMGSLSQISSNGQTSQRPSFERAFVPQPTSQVPPQPVGTSSQSRPSNLWRDPFTGTEYPQCLSATSDPDKDGWGWENGKSCKVL